MKFVLKEVRVWGRRAFGCTPVSPGAMQVPPRRSGLPSLDRARRQLVSPPSPAVIIKCTYLSMPHPLPLTAVISRGLEGEKKKKLTKAFRKTPAVPKRATGLPLPAAALGAHALLFGLGIWVGIVPAGPLRPCRGCCGMQLEVLMMGAPPAAALRGAWQRPAQPAASPWLFASEFPGAGGKLGNVFFFPR